MVEQLHIQKLACLDDGTRNCYIVWAWGRIAGWVVVDNNDIAGIAADRSFENLGNAYLRRIDTSLIHRFDVAHSVSIVHKQDTQLFMLQGTHIVLNQLSGIGWAMDKGS